MAVPTLALTHDPKATVPVAMAEVSEQARPAVAVVEQFSAALHAGDLDRVGALLADDVLILESGGAERSRAEYLGGHAIHDAAFLKAAHVQVKQRTARVDGATAWVGTESEVHTSKDGKALTLLSTETMVLKLTEAGWRIVHIHWSSRPKKEDKPASGAMPPASQQSIATTGSVQDVTRGS
jgi:ketosteroid isomerase-like protein